MHPSTQTGGFDDVYDALNKRPGECLVYYSLRYCADDPTKHSRTQSYVAVTSLQLDHRRMKTNGGRSHSGIIHRSQSSWCCSPNGFSERTDEPREYGEWTDGLATSSCYERDGQSCRSSRGILDFLRGTIAGQR